MQLAVLSTPPGSTNPKRAAAAAAIKKPCHCATKDPLFYFKCFNAICCSFTFVVGQTLYYNVVLINE